MSQNDAKFRTDSSPTHYVALAVIPLTVIAATVIGTVAATHIISQAFAEIQASAGIASRYVSRNAAKLAPIPTPSMPGLVAPPSVQIVLSTQSARVLEQVRVATMFAPAPKPITGAKLLSVPIKVKPAQVAESPYAQVAAQ
jgi:hypothetical protein